MSKNAKMPLFIAKITKTIRYDDGATAEDTYFPHPLVFPDEGSAISSFLEAVKGIEDTTMHEVYRIGYYCPIDGTIKLHKERKKVYPYEDA